MKHIFLMLFAFVVLFNIADAGELYKCIDKDGSIFITDGPKDGMKCNLKVSYGDSYSGRSKSYGKRNPATNDIDEQLDKLESKSKKSVTRTRYVQGIQHTKGHVEEYSEERGLTDEERRQQTDLLRLKARLSGGQISSRDDMEENMIRKERDEEDAKTALKSKISNLENEKRALEFEKRAYEHKQRMQKFNQDMQQVNRNLLKY